MPTVRYTTIEGEVIAEKRGGVRKQYVPDPLGSTVALLDASQSQTDTFSYWPYGEEQSRTGSTSTPLRFVGTLGYYRDSTARTYVRARYLDTQKGRWVTEDPIKFAGQDWNIYRYVSNNPAVYTDVSGLQFLFPPIPIFVKPDRAIKCAGCADDIHNAWSPDPTNKLGGGRTWFHDCNHRFVHCMACCTLTKAVDADCAHSTAVGQDWVTAWEGGSFRPSERTSSCRMGACNVGIKIGRSNSSCFDACINAFPFNSGPNCSSSRGSKIDCQKYKRKEGLHSMPPLKKGSFCSLDECWKA